ncbi:hypothetical protein BACCELL_04653 [Bacteroides cellulosilyticus DSM 14838]|uniref:Uncharacterized protein n=1 Tax=Bacteroides cellulosilyticus DSM 14838 TaxID=537012 RepID=E2NK13_9BACE|nr:hypothetical protein BACCELL_04653 [Bacteroides cellulosilyticus DSM 14838]
MLVGGVKVAQIKELKPPLAHLFAKKGKAIRVTSYERLSEHSAAARNL